MDDLTNRVALVTGSSRGIGRAVARTLAQAGCDLVLNYRTRAEDAAVLHGEIARMGRRCLAVQADVSLAVEAESLVRAALDFFGAVDILVNNAGIAVPQRPEEITESDWDQVLSVNLKSCWLVTQAALPSMRARNWGRIVNISSVAAHIGGSVGAHYAASKAGMLGLTHYFAAALIKEGITSNAISPGLIETDMVRDTVKASPSRVPVGRFGAPEEVSDAVLMLCRNGYITGENIHVNGGMYQG